MVVKGGNLEATPVPVLLAGRRGTPAHFLRRAARVRFPPSPTHETRLLPAVGDSKTKLAPFRGQCAGRRPRPPPPCSQSRGPPASNLAEGERTRTLRGRHGAIEDRSTKALEAPFKAEPVKAEPVTW